MNLRIVLLGEKNKVAEDYSKSDIIFVKPETRKTRQYKV